MKKFIIFCLLFITSCNNPYKHYFTKSPRADSTIFYQGEPQINYSNSLQNDLSTYQRKGYGIIGFSSFNNSEVGNDRSSLKSLAKEIGAEVVLWNQVYTNTVSGSTPYTSYTPQTQTSYYNGSINNSYTPLSSYSYRGNITTYSQQQNTTYVPYNIRRYDYSAVFLGKVKDLRFGFLARDLSDEERIANHLKSGIYVAIIVNNSPAFDSELSEGDIIMTINEKLINNLEDFMSLDINSMKKVKIEFLRSKKKKITFIDLGKRVFSNSEK